MTEIIIPAMGDEENQKFIDAIEAIGKLMDTDIAIEKVFSLKLTFSSMRGDVRTVLSDLVESKTKKKAPRGKDIQVGRGNPDFDPKNL